MDAPRFLTLKAEEDVLRVLRASVVPHAPKLVALTLFVIVPFLLLFPLWREGTWGIIVFVMWLLIASILLWRAYLSWARTLLIVTDQRVVDHDQRGFFHREVTEARYSQIDEVSYTVKGVAPTLFGYGTVRIQLHGAAADIEVEELRRPSSVVDTINDLRLAYAKE